MAKRILIVDDEKDIRALIKALLEDAGYQVAEAKDGKECIAKLGEEKFNLVLIDFFMPEMSGRELAERLRKNPKTKNTKFAFLTIAIFSKKGEEELKRLGSLDYIKKPIDNEDFKKRVKKMLSK